jgi:DNA-binding MarR family transcriptional regulator
MRGAQGGDPIDPVADVRRGVVRLSQRLRAERPDYALSTNKVAVLGHLHRRGPSTPGDIAAAERQQPQSLSRVFADLQADGLISRSPSARDRRESVLDITEAGRDALLVDMAQRDRWLADAMAALTDAEAQILHVAAGLMERLVDGPREPVAPAPAGPAAPTPVGRGADRARERLA